MEASSVFATWFQAITAFAALILSFIVAFQNKRIKELEDIASKLTALVSEQNAQTKELSAQSKTLQQRLDIEKHITLMQRVPFFRKHHSQGIPQRTLHTISIYNTGTIAHNLNVKQPLGTEDIYRIKGPFPKIIENSALVTVVVQYANYELADTHLFSIDLVSENEAGETVSQTLKLAENKSEYYLSSPKDY